MQSAQLLLQAYTAHALLTHKIEFLASTDTKQHKEQAAETHVGAVNWVVEHGRNGTRESSTASEKFQ